MLDYKTILGVLAVAIGFVGYFIYFKQIFSGKIKPHAFAWFVWGLLTAIVFAAQMIKGAGPGAWNTAAASLACFTVAGLAFFKGYRDFVKSDWILSGSALVAMFLWWLTSDPLLSVILVTLADAFGSIMIVRKSYHKPSQESVTLFTLNSVKAVIALFALNSYVLTTWLYPAYLILGNGMIALVVWWRRRKCH